MLKPPFPDALPVGDGRGSSAVPPWPTTTPLRSRNPSTTYLHRCGIPPGARWCPWIRRRSSPSASICRRRGPLFSVSLTCGSRLPVTQRSPPSFYSNPDFWFSCKNHISCFWDPKIVKPILWYSLRWLVFNKNIKWTMFLGKIFINDLILLFMDKCISLVILLSLLWNFYGSLCMVLECFDKYFMIFEVMQLWYVIYVWDLACFPE